MIVLALLVVGFQMVAVYGQDRQGPWDFQHCNLELRASSFMPVILLFETPLGLGSIS